MSPASAARYVSDSIHTASPARLVTMLYDRLALDLERACFALDTSDRAFADEQLRHAQEIVMELRSGLDVTAWDGGPRMAALYDWLLKELVFANTRQDKSKVTACLRIVEELGQAWHGAARLVETGAA